ncbi:MAG: glutamate 5-kinase, partial [Pseudomonadota bacterium]
YKRIVVKIGSALLVDPAAGLREHWLRKLCDDLAELQRQGSDVLVVSSGAIAMGRTILGMTAGDLKLEESQAAAAVGQIALAHDWNAALGANDITSGQILLTLEDTESRRRFLNARATINALLKMKAVPVINENDTVATSEIRYGDNDRLAARVATMVGADLLVLLSDVDGLYTSPPSRDPDARHLPVIETITPEIEAMAGQAASNLSRGGMRTKLDAAKIATQAGTAMIIADGRVDNPLSELSKSDAKYTLFKAAENPVSAWKSWIAGQLEPQGIVTIDEGAVRALKAGKSLLPAGIRAISGEFSRGDTVAVKLVETHKEIARGLTAYDSAELSQIAGRKTNEIELILGHAPRAAAIHRDDLVLK